MESSTNHHQVPATAPPPPQEIVNLVDRHTARLHTMLSQLGCVPDPDFDKQCHAIAMRYVTDTGFSEERAWNAMLDLCGQQIPQDRHAQFAWGLVRKTMGAHR